MDTNEKKGPYKAYVKKLKNGFELTSLEPVRISNWVIKGSVSNKDTVVIIMSHECGLTRIGTFSDENDANDFVVYWLESLE